MPVRLAGNDAGNVDAIPGLVKLGTMEDKNNEKLSRLCKDCTVIETLYSRRIAWGS